MYAAEITNSETMETTLIGQYNTEAEAIAKAQEAAAAAEYDGSDAFVVVNDADGNQVWDNEGDWRNAVR